MALTYKQKRVAFHLYSVGKKKKVPRKDLLSAIATALVEANLGNPKTPGPDSGTSVGWRQETTGSYGGKNRTNIRESAGRYYDELRGAGPGTIGQRAQAVQRSAYPGRYDERKGEAEQILRWLEKTYGRGGGTSAKAGAKTVQTSPGVDNSGARKELQYQALSQSNPFDLTKLLSLKAQTDQLQDVAPTSKTVVRKGAPNATPSGAPGSVMSILKTAVAQSKTKQPYLWGGGHGGIAKVGDAVDCSGYWSMLLPGLKGPMVSGQMASYGKPGRGKWVTIYADKGHVLGSIKDPRTGKVRWFATSKSNPGGGAGEISKPSAGYLSRFAVRHPKGL